MFKQTILCFFYRASVSLSSRQHAAKPSAFTGHLPFVGAEKLAIRAQISNDQNRYKHIMIQQKIGIDIEI